MGTAWTRRVAISGIACLAIAACDAAASPTGGGEVVRVASPTPTRVPTPTPIPTPEPTPTPIPVWDDLAFQERSRTLCDGARPKDLYDITGPYLPPEKAPGYDGVHIVVLELRDPDGAIGPPPALRAGEVYYNDYTVKQLDAYRVHAIFPERVDLLACLALRAGEPQLYGSSLAVAPAAAIVWMADPVAGARVGEPWLIGEPHLGDVLLQHTISLGRTWLDASQQKIYNPLLGVVPAALGIAQFLGLVGPAAGGLQSDFGWCGETSDLTLPEGACVYDATFVLRLVVLENGNPMIDFVEVFCAPDGTVGPPQRVATNVPLGAEWQAEFEAASVDVSVTGSFRGAGAAEGTIRALSANARACGIPDEAEWFAGLQLDVVPAGDRYVASVRAGE